MKKKKCIHWMFLKTIFLLFILSYGFEYASADTILFKDTRLGWIKVAAFDWAPGNSLLDEAIPFANDPEQSNFRLLYQAKLAGFIDENNNLITGTGLGIDYEITIVTGTSFAGSQIISSFGQSASFIDDSNSTPNFIAIYYDEILNANDLMGTGFKDGSLLMQGQVISGFGTIYVPFGINGKPIISNLDQFNNNNYPGVGTVKADGGYSLMVNIDESTINDTYVDVNNKLLSLITVSFNSNSKTPFIQSDPSAQFWDGSIYINPERGSDITGGLYQNGINGIQGAQGQVDFQLQADANSSFVVVSPCIEVTKSCTNASAPDQPIYFSGTVTNCGNETLNNVMVTDDHAGVVLGPISLDPGASANYSGSYVPSVSPSTNTVTASGTGAISGTIVTDNASATCKINTSPDILVNKTCTDAPAPGQPINFSATITNTGNETLNNITCSDQPPTALSGVPTSLAPGASAIVTGSYYPNSSPSTDILTCSGTGAISGVIVTSSDDATCKINTVVSMTLDKTCKDITNTGQFINITAVLKNTGNETLTEINCVDDPPITLSGVPISLDPGASAIITGSYIPVDNPSTDTLTCTAKGAISNTPTTASDSATCARLYGGCRMTGGNNTVEPDGTVTWIEGTYAEVVKTVTNNTSKKCSTTTFKYTVGGQIGAPQAGCLNAPDSQFGEWEHSHHENGILKFSFHSGTHSSPLDAYIKCITCADPGWCVQARCAPFKQIFWEGTGVFQNPNPKSDTPFKLNGCYIDPKPGSKYTLHYYKAHVGDFGEPGNTGKQKSYDPNVCHWTSGGVDPSKINLMTPQPPVPDPKFGDKGGQACDSCPDYYEITIWCKPTDPDTDPSNTIIYKASGYITGGNHQIHPEVGQHCPY